jgi:glycosyltransferase involved in cell wall biosynthesis
LNVLVLAQYFPPDIGGSATRVYNVAKGLTLNGCKVTVVAAFPHYPHGKIPTEYKWKPIKVEQMENFKVIRTFMPPIKSVGFFRRLVLVGAFAVSSLFALPFIGEIDAVWASSCCPGFLFSRTKRKPLALNVDDLTLEDLVDLELINENSRVLKIGEWIYRLFLVKADILTPISSGYFETLSKKYCVKPNKIHLVRGGVDLSTFKQHMEKSQHPEKFTVLYSGAFSVAYDFNQIFRAAKILEEVDKDIEFVVQGTGELLGSMCESVRQLDVKNVNIINKILSRAEVAELLGQANILILPLATFYKSGKPYRGMSSKLYEYQAIGKPIICCSKGTPSTYVEETSSGLVIDPGDSEALANAIMKLKQNPSLARGMGENGRKYVENEASIEAVGLNLRQIMQKEFEA